MKQNLEIENRPGSDRYFNREYSWLLFNQRVLEEASNSKNPLFERLKFLSIFESNLDEFYMVRVTGLLEQVENKIDEFSMDGLTPREQLILISKTVAKLRQQASELWSHKLSPLLSKENIHLKEYKHLSPKQQASLTSYFEKEIFPLCTPLILHPAPTVPFISNRCMNLAVVLSDSTTGIKIARVKVPTVIPRIISVNAQKVNFILLEDFIQHHLQHLFPGVKILGAYPFRVLRDADIEIRELEAGDLMDAVEASLRLRRFGSAVLLQINPSMPQEVRDILLGVLELDPEDILEVHGMLDFEALSEITHLEKPHLNFPKHYPFIHEQLSDYKTLFETIETDDILLHHPYDSFEPVEQFITSAAKDPEVIGIKQTLYRVGAESPIVQSLLDAAKEGKQVAITVELKARFDESNNLVWARALEHEGAHVTYGFPELKTHCKLCIIVRRVGRRTRTYVHIGTGNYNPTTSRIYTDLGLFTSDPDITQDVLELFNFLTGFSKQTEYRKLLVAPINLRQEILKRIYKEIETHRITKKGRLIFKLNALVDQEMIDALYQASQAGVQVDLITRGICCLKPGVSGLSDHIRVVSIVGMFLEHSRVYYFENDGHPEAFIGSADLMTRNLDRRVEVLVPVENLKWIEHLREHLLENCFQDNQNAWVLSSDGTYKRKKPEENEEDFSLQKYLMQHPSTKLFMSSVNDR